MNNNNNHSTFRFKTFPLDNFLSKQPNPHTFAISERAKKIVEEMSIREKIGQMTQLDVTMILNEDGQTINQTLLKKAVYEYGVGSFLNSPYAGGKVNGVSGMNVTEWIQFQITLQESAIQYSNSSIPIIYGLDSVHGANYIYGAVMFPHNLAVGATFDPQLAIAIGEVASRDTRTAGMPWVFAPVADLGINPLWPRLYETYGEDPLLVSHMVNHSVLGIQGYPNENLIEYGSACLKHFLGYSDPKSGKDRSPAWISERQMKRYFLPGYEAAIKAGVRSVMINSGSVNYIPVHSDSQYLIEWLRNQLEFNGLAVTDWQDIEKLTFFHHIAENYIDATHIGIDAGIDMSMVPSDYSFPDDLLYLVDSGIISLDRIDESVQRIIQLKIDIGVLDQLNFPSLDNPNITKVGSNEDRELSLQVARESITLLRNEKSILPLDATSLSQILLTGPAANSLSIQNGGWSIHWQGAEDSEFPFGVTILDGVKSIGTSLNSELKVVYELGSGLNKPANLTAAIEAAKESDVVILCFGEEPEAETPGDINNLQIDPFQLNLYHQLRSQTNTPIILILVEARPRIISEAEFSNAILMSYLPSSEGGQAIAEILFGITNPSGRLSLTYPQFPNDIGVPYYKTYTDTTTPLFEFASGLSYTQFNYTSLSISSKYLYLGETLDVNVTLSNIGSRSGKEVVLLYLSDLYASVLPEVKMLKRFLKIELSPQETTTINWNLTMEDLAYIGRDDKSVVELGEFVLSVSNLSTNFTLLSPPPLLSDNLDIFNNIL